MKIYDCVQGSPEWHKLRCGVPSASNFDRIVTPKTGQLSKGADDYICELIAGRNADSWPESYVSPAMQNGIDMEPEARAWFAMNTDCEVRKVGWCTTDDGLLGCSPDGLIADSKGVRGGLEIKYPTPKIHVKYMLSGEMPAEYKPQVYGSLVVCDLEFWTFLSYSTQYRPLIYIVIHDDYAKKVRDALAEFKSLYQLALAKFEKVNSAVVCNFVILGERNEGTDHTSGHDAISGITVDAAGQG